MAISRRTFLSGSLATGAAGLTFPLPRVRGANDDLRVAVIGLRGQGGTHVAKFQSIPGVRVVALCDADADVLGAKVEAFATKYGHRPQAIADLRRVFDAKDIDIVSTATPNHWHALIGVWACETGKDAYIEKPVSHNVWEGRQLVAAARKYGRIVQGGTQSRSQPGIRAAVEFVRSGKLGALQLVHGLCYKPRQSIGKVGRGQPPKHVDYDLWCGPAPHEPLRRRQLHYDWHWQWATGNGDLGNQGIHQVDVGRWLLGEKLPRRVLSIGGRVGYDDDGETPNTQLVWFDYASAPFVFEVRGLPRDQAAQRDWGKSMDVVPGFERSGSIGVVAHCAQGRVVIDTARARAYDGEGQQIAEWKDDGDHYQNFIDAVRARDGQRLHADVEETHLSSALCHLGGISHLLGQPAATPALQQALPSEGPVPPLFAAMLQHLQRNGVTDATPLRLGRRLELDADCQSIVGDHAATALLTRPYRKGFVVPTLT